MGMLLRGGSWLLAGLLVAGCGAPVSPPDPTWQRVAIVELTPGRTLDILFVLDDTSGMDEPHQVLAAAFPLMLDGLRGVDGALPDLHVGVVSSDVGAGPYDISDCYEDGDDGRLQVQPRVNGCAPPTDPFIRDVDDGAGGRERNYPGGLEDAFECISQLGANGCGFEQHLESMRRALDGSMPFNDGFLRPEAHLLVVVLADEDDCSTRDTEMFDTLQDQPSDPLGPLSSFRCFEFGVDCETGNDDPRAPGARDGCHPREDSPYMYPVQSYVDFLRGLKSEAGRVSVVTIVGSPEPVAVGRDPERPDNAVLVASCRSGFGPADAGVRLSWFAAQFAARNVQATICDEDFTPVTRAAATLVSNAMSTSCLTAPVAGSLAELAASCRAFDVIGLDTDAEQRTPLAACEDTGGAVPCFSIVADERCTLNEARASVVVERGGDMPSVGTQIVVECVVP